MALHRAVSAACADAWSQATDLRGVLDALRYLARTGGRWPILPNDLPPWQTVYWWFRLFVRRLLFKTINDVALMLDRGRVSREPSPTVAVVDSQSIKAPAAEKRGLDAGTRVVGRKRHIAVDSDGRLLMVNVTAADISDSAGAQFIDAAIRKRWPWLKHPFADGAYDRTRLMDATGTHRDRHADRDRDNGSDQPDENWAVA